MRLHRLQIVAFGPFARPQTIDFEDLSASGLFLVHGATGAGKTSVLDAVCFALFADVPGARSVRGLRSDLAPPRTSTAVTLDFTASGRRLRVTRSPEQVRPKLRGSGMVRAPATVVLEELHGGAWTVRSTRIDEAAEVIADAVGLGLAQFQRIALLPQGDFAAFLRADARDRHRLLTALFDVSAFEDAETWLGDRRRKVAAAQDAAERELGYCVRSLIELLSALPAGTLDLPGPDLSTVVPDEWSGLSPLITGQVRQAAADAAGELSVALDEDDAAHRDLTAAQAVAHTRRRGEQARAEAALLRDQEPEVAGARERCAAAARAERMRPQLHAVAQAEAAVLRTRGHLSDAGRSLAALGTRVDLGDVSLATTLERATRVLACATSPAEELARGGAELASAADRIRSAREAARSVEAEHHARLAAIATLTASTAELAADRDRLPELLTRQRSLADAVAIAQAAADTQSEREEAARAELAAERAAVTAHAALLSLERARVADLAAQLAGGLVTGDACPVCGSREHPDPAIAGADWSPEALSAAEAALRERRAAVDRARLSRAALDERLDGAQSRLHGLGVAGVPLEELRTRAKAAAGDLAAAQERAKLLVAQTEQLSAERSAAGSSEADLRTCRVEVAVAVAAQDALWQRLARAVAAVDEGIAAHSPCPCLPAPPDQAHDAFREEISPRTGLATTARTDEPTAVGSEPVAPAEAARAAQVLARLREHHTATVREVASVQTHAERHAAATEALDLALHQLAAALTGSAFATRAEATAALLPPEEADRLGALIGSHERRSAVAAATLAEPEVRAALAAPAPDVAALSSTASQRRTAAQLATRRTHELERIAGAATGVLGALTAAAADVVRRREEALRIGALADLAAGTSPENTLRMRLSTFVLAARLERVVELANERLSAMGEGRFQLSHDDSLAGHGARSGLGLLIRDEWSGAQRSPASLSGGESFMASVALALGLADALRESTGGVELQTLFIDEGFGSLDEQSLEDVMGVLDGLLDGGRAVGVVSHLAELRDRIPSQLAVHKSTSGSEVTQTTGQAASA